jgi:excisionase family DNA binding protein
VTGKCRTYRAIFKKYPDVVSVEQMCQILGDISKKTGYRLLKEKRIDYFVIGKVYKIPKINIIQYMSENSDSTRELSK